MLGVAAITCDRAALAAGDSRRYSLLMAVRAALRALAFLVGAEMAGLQGALIGQALSLVLIYSAIVVLTKRYQVWDRDHDLAIRVAVLPPAAALWLNADYPSFAS